MGLYFFFLAKSIVIYSANSVMYSTIKCQVQGEKNALKTTKLWSTLCS